MGLGSPERRVRAPAEVELLPYQRTVEYSWRDCESSECYSHILDICARFVRVERESS